MGYLARIGSYLNKGLAIVSGVAVLILTAIAAGNMLFRVVWVPIPGSYELIGFFGAAATGLALGYTQMRKDHIIVTIFTDKFPKKTNRFLDGLNYLVNMVFFSVVAWETLKWGMKIARTGELSETLKIIYHPFVYLLALGFAALAFNLLLDLLGLLKRSEKK